MKLYDIDPCRSFLFPPPTDHLTTIHVAHWFIHDDSLQEGGEW